MDSTKNTFEQKNILFTVKLSSRPTSLNYISYVLNEFVNPFWFTLSSSPTQRFLIIFAFKNNKYFITKNNKYFFAVLSKVKLSCLNEILSLSETQRDPLTTGRCTVHRWLVDLPQSRKLLLRFLSAVHRGSYKRFSKNFNS